MSDVTTSDVRIGLIGGSGLGHALAKETRGHAHEVDTPFGRPSGAIVEFEQDGIPVFFLPRHGPGHVLNPSQVPYRANIFALKTLGVTHILASGAVGSLRDEVKPRDLVIIDQVIDKTRREGTFFEKAAVHVEFAEPFCPVLRQILLECGKGVMEHPSTNEKFSVHDGGCYVVMEGPAFSTRAESLMHRLWGGDVIGMTAMPEAKLAREAEIAYAMVALATDYDCWKIDPKKAEKPDAKTLLEEIIHNLHVATDNAILLLRHAISAIAKDPARAMTSPALEALKLAIWSEKSKIPRDEALKLAPLWLKYLS